MDVVYLYRRSPHDDLELRYSLRSLRHLAFVDRVWILGDRPKFLGDSGFVRHVGHEEFAWLGRFRVPVTNMFVMVLLASLIPELSFEFLVFCDDYVILGPYSEEQARRLRFVEDLAEIETRGRGLWKDALWRTGDLLHRLGYGTLNFETHTPCFLTKRWVWDAFRALREFITEDRFYGPLAFTAIYNHVLRSTAQRLWRRDEEGLFVGMHGRPWSTTEIEEACRGRTLLNFDDSAFGEGLQEFLVRRFPEPEPWEGDGGTQ